ncbi:NAD(P)H-dependent oxidoreductase [bacterium]
MKLIVYNGSPRGKDSNTKILLTHFLNGFMAVDGNSFELAYLVHINEHEKLIELFSTADHVLFAFPLYFDSMPSNVKYFIEELEPFCHRQDNPSLGFIVQSGFPESRHSRALERYLKKLAARLNCTYKGTIIRGSVEAIKMLAQLENPFQKFIVSMGKITNMGQVGGFFSIDKLYKQFYQLGLQFGQSATLDRKIIEQLAKPEKLTRLGFQLFKSVGDHFYWNNWLKKNKAFKKRFDAPYSQ